MASSETFHFDEFTLDARERRLLRGAEVVRLSPKTYDVLVALVRQRGRLVTKDELLTRLWPRLFVEEGSHNVYVSSLRKALGEEVLTAYPAFAHDRHALVPDKPHCRKSGGVPKASASSFRITDNTSKWLG